MSLFRQNPLWGFTIDRTLAMDDWIWDPFVAELTSMIDAFDAVGLRW